MYIFDSLMQKIRNISPRERDRFKKDKCFIYIIDFSCSLYFFQINYSHSKHGQGPLRVDGISFLMRAIVNSEKRDFPKFKKIILEKTPKEVCTFSFNPRKYSYLLCT